MKNFSRELSVEGKVYDNIEAYMKFKNEYLKIIKEEYQNNFDDCRIMDEEKMEKFISKILSELPNHKFLQQLSFKDLLWDFDAVSLYPSAMSDEKKYLSEKRNKECFYTRYDWRIRWKIQWWKFWTNKCDF